MTDEERIFSCQQEIRRLRGVVREYEEERRAFIEWLEEESKIPSKNQTGLNVVKQYLEYILGVTSRYFVVKRRDKLWKDIMRKKKLMKK